MGTAEPLSFDSPPAATVPPEERGLTRESVRMLVAHAPGRLRGRRVGDLTRVLGAGDVLVLNGSDTLPASLRGVTELGERVEVHLSTVDPSSGDTPAEALRSRRSRWIVEVRTPAGPASTASPVDRGGVLVRIGGGARLRLERPYVPGALRLWRAGLDTPDPLLSWLRAHGAPIRYGHVSGAFPLSVYRTQFGDTPGSAEMPSAGRSLTTGLLRRLRDRGVEVARLVLHTGVSSQEAGEPPYPEWYEVPDGTARAVTAARRDGRRVVAVGTTVVRALEASGGRAGAGWTDLVVTPRRGVSVVDGMLTGWHEPRGSHLLMLEALAGSELLRESYRAAFSGGYLWHEFGDLHLILPDRSP